MNSISRQDTIGSEMHKTYDWTSKTYDWIILFVFYVSHKMKNNYTFKFNNNILIFDETHF